MNKKLEIASIKCFPILANGVMLVLMLFQLFHIEVRTFVSFFIGCSLWSAYNLTIQSKQLHFCSWHRILLYNTMFYAVLQIASRIGIEFNYYLYVALVINLLTLVLATVLYFKDGCYIQKSSKRVKKIRS